jgi:hypothetical protein
MTLRNDERGIALPLALLVLIVVGALVVGSFFTARLEQQSGRNTLFAAQAREAAEAGLSQALATVDAAMLEAIAIGGPPLSLGAVNLSNGARAGLDVRRLTGALFLVRVQGWRPDAGGMVLATRSLGAVVQLMPAAVAGAGGLQPRLAERGWLSLY